MGYARPLGQTVSVRHRNLTNAHGVCGSVALIQIGILSEEFRLCLNPIGWLVEIQFLAVGHHLDPVMHYGINGLVFIISGSLFHASDFVFIALPLSRVTLKIVCFWNERCSIAERCITATFMRRTKVLGSRAN